MRRCLLVGSAGASLLLFSCARPNPLFGLGSSETDGATDDGGSSSTSQTTGTEPNPTVGTADPTSTTGDVEDDDGSLDTTDGDVRMDLGPAVDANDSGVEPSQCCESSRLPGCADPTIEACVCDLDLFCCDDQWDAICVDTALLNCNVECPNDGMCCTQAPGSGCGDAVLEDCVCNQLAVCCEGSWTIDCVLVAEQFCNAECSSANDCCVDNPAVPGCNDPAVWGCVCETDQFCCETGWDETCVATATACGACP